jgi:hypothetical protein
MNISFKTSMILGQAIQSLLQTNGLVNIEHITEFLEPQSEILVGLFEAGDEHHKVTPAVMKLLECEWYKNQSLHLFLASNYLELCQEYYGVKAYRKALIARIKEKLKYMR